MAHFRELPEDQSGITCMSTLTSYPRGPRLQKCRQICIFSMPLVFTGIYGIYGKYGGKYGIYGKFNGQLSNISVLNNTP